MRWMVFLHFFRSLHLCYVLKRLYRGDGVTFKETKSGDCHAGGAGDDTAKEAAGHASIATANAKSELEHAYAGRASA